VVGLISLGCIAGGVVFTMGSIDKLNNLVSTLGTIIGTELCSSTTPGSDTYSAIIEYYDSYNNATFVFTAEHCSSPPPTVGNSITVLFDPEEPGVGFDGSFLGLWLFPIILFGFGVATIIFFTFLACCFCKARSVPQGAKIDNPTVLSSGPSSYPHSSANDVEVAPSAPPTSTYNYSSNPSSNTNTGTSLFDQMNTKWSSTKWGSA